MYRFEPTFNSGARFCIVRSEKVGGNYRIVPEIAPGKANDRAAPNPEYEHLAPNRLRDRAVLPDHFFFVGN